MKDVEDRSTRDLFDPGIHRGGLLDAVRQADGLTASVAHRQLKQEELEELQRKKLLTPIIGRRPR